MALTIKQEKFCMAYIETGNASEAYRQCYSTSKMKTESVNRLAFALLQNVKIISRLDELKAQHAKRHNMTVDDLIAEYEENRQAALQSFPAQVNAANGSTTGKAKLLGLFIEKSENRHTVKIDDVKDLTDEELDAELAKLGITD